MKLLFSISFLLIGLLSYSQTFDEIIKAAASDRGENDRFGYAVAIDGNYAVIGAYADDFSGSDPNMGSVYVYEKQGQNSWIEIQKLFNSDQDDYDRFGWSVAIHGDYLVIGAYGEDHDENDANTMSKAGSAYIFKNTAGTWTEVQKIVASDRDIDDEFGWSVAIYDSTIIVGAHIEDHDVAGNNFMYHSGSVYSFEMDVVGVWSETQKITADDRWVDINFPNGYSGEDLADQFGGSCDLWGDYLIVGAHHHDYATIVPLTGGLWSSGAAYIFERNGGVWTQVQKIQNFDRESWDRFGYAVAIDTNVIVVCAYSEDEVEDGVSNPLTNPGSAYLFERDLGGTWNAGQKIVPNDRTSGDHFGYSVDIDDTLMVLGCHSDDHDEFAGDLKTDAGSAYIFEKNAGVWTQFQKIDASDRAEEDDHGISVGISGYTVVVGAQYNDFNSTGVDSLDDAGAAYFYSNNLCSALVANITPAICEGNTYTVGTSNYTASGSYSDLILSVGGCDSMVNTILTVDPTYLTDEYASMCDGGTYYIYGVATTVPGNYSSLFITQNGCDSTIITHLTADAPILSQQFISICYGDSYSIGTSTYTEAGTYEDIVSATNFCDSTITTILSIVLPADNSITQSNSMLIANEDETTYQWLDCVTNTILVGETNQVFYAPVIGNYAVIIEKNGCPDTSACVYVSWITANTIDLILEQAVSIYPNPSNGTFIIDLSIPLIDGELIIYAVSGEIILQQKMTSTSVKVSGLSAGLYIAEIRNGEGIVRKRVVVE